MACRENFTKASFLNLFTEKCRERLLRVVWRWQQQQIKGTQYNERNHPSKAKRCSTATFCYSTLFIIAIARILYCTRVASKFSSKGKGRKCKQTFTRFFNSIWISRVKVKLLWFRVVVNYVVLCSPLSGSIWYFRGLGRSDRVFFKYDWFCRRDGWQLFSSMQVWEQLVNQTKRASKDHAALADIYGTHISQRCNNITEDLQRMYKKVRVQSQSYSLGIRL